MAKRQIAADVEYELYEGIGESDTLTATLSIPFGYEVPPIVVAYQDREARVDTSAPGAIRDMHIRDAKAYLKLLTAAIGVAEEFKRNPHGFLRELDTEDKIEWLSDLVGRSVKKRIHIGDVI